MKILQMFLIFIAAFSLGVYLTEQKTKSQSDPMPIAMRAMRVEACKTDLLIVFPFQILQQQLANVLHKLYEQYPTWSVQRDGATLLNVVAHIPDASAIDEIKLESKAHYGQPALCLTLELREEIETLAADVLRSEGEE